MQIQVGHGHVFADTHMHTLNKAVPSLERAARTL